MFVLHKFRKQVKSIASLIESIYLLILTHIIRFDFLFYLKILVQNEFI